MAKEKSVQVKQVSPLPVGRYWLDINGESLISDWNDWKKDVAQSLRVESNEETPGHLFVIFKVIDNAAFFPSERFGFPNTAPSWIVSSQDVLGVPDPGPPGAEDLLQFFKTAGKIAAGLFVAKLAVDLFRKN